MMQKRRKLQVFEYAGAGWYGEIYEDRSGRWSWAVGLDFGDHGLFQGCVGFTSKAAAERSMRAFINIQVEREYGNDLVPYLHM